MEKKFVTMKDIASVLGVSVTTVSKALKNHPDISADMIRKIKKTANDLGYSKNYSASLLRGNKSKIIGVVMSDVSNPFFTELLLGIQEVARKKGYEILFSSSQGNEEYENQAIETLLNRRVDGLIICPIQQEFSQFDKYNLREKAVITGNIPSCDIDYVVSDEFKGSYMATKHLIDSGCGKIAMLNNYLHLKSSLNKRFDGYKAALLDSGIGFDESLLLTVDRIIPPHRLQDGYDDIKEFILKNTDIDGIFCFNDLLAFGTLKVLNELNIKIPEQISVVGYDNIDFSEIITPALSSIQIHKYEMGKLAMKMLLDRIEKPEMEFRKNITDVELIIRNSSGK